MSIEGVVFDIVKADLKFLKKAGLNFPSPSVRTGL